MKNIILAASSLIFFFLWAVVQQAAAAKTDPNDLIASLNSKTAEIKTKRVSENKGTTFIDQDVNSYVFSLKEKLLTIEFDEEIRSFKNGPHIRTDRDFGFVSMDSEQIDPGKTGIGPHGSINIVCRDNKKCMTRELQSIVYYVKEKKTVTEAVTRFAIITLQIQGADQPLAEQISKELTALFTVLETPPKPVEKNATNAASKK